MLGKKGVKVYSRPLKYTNEEVRLPTGGTTTKLVGREKGIDVRLALDVVRLAREKEFDVALIFSQDQDLKEVVDEVRAVADEQGRWMQVASAFPCSPTTANRRGIRGALWIKIDRAVYDTCIDPADYRPKKT